MPVRVLIVDDHAGFRRVARRLLQDMGRLVVGEAGTGHEALSEARRLKPDLVLLDIQLPDLDGLAVARSLSSDPNPPAVVLVSSRDAADYGPSLDGCGALGFIAKADLTAESLTALLGA
ncbi:MAG TPA: response regulator [Candidatus Dormibacteraeota bacterium]|nr:response regulator [Candidatus Dormibacteraeota bacterium]